MSGIYIHIPFCKTKCYYCDFHTSANYKYKDDYISALIEEIDLQKDFIFDKNIETIYFGGGTPSTVYTEDISRIIAKIKETFLVIKTPEITLEANPDDLSEKYLHNLINIGVNRLSIGIQSFSNEYLKLMNRRHNAKTASIAVKNAQKIGFDNISLDLIYGLPDSDLDFLKHEADNILELNPQHISAYHLTIEDKTVFKKYIEKRKISEITDINSEKQFLYLNNFFENNGFEHYEISNFAKKAFISKHNSNYWANIQYLGIGSSAHSYNGNERMWNIANVKKYIESIELKQPHYEKENLSKKDKFNEYLLTGLRTSKGVDIKFISKQFGDKYTKLLLANVNKLNLSDIIILKKNVLFLSKIGWFTSDKIILELFLNEEI